MNTVAILLMLGFLIAATSATAADYYLRASGDDNAAGTSAESAWKTIERLQKAKLESGDRVLLEGGASFKGSLELKSGGTKEKPIVITSFGDGVASIDAGDGDGIKAHNLGGIELRKLKITGSGREKNKGEGISFYNDLAGDVKLDRIVIDEVEVSGFGKHGVTIGGYNGKSGFRGVRVTKTVFHSNGHAGLSMWGYCPEEFKGWSHEDVYVGHCKAYDNSGLPEKMDNHSGSGIVVGGVDGLVIEHCQAWNNGWLCNAKVGGPVGIWAWDSNRALIQFCEAHHNRTGKGSLDGGGFDFDGGVTNSIMQFNYSHENDGAGFLICQYKGARPFHNNVVRYNISQNDGRQHGYGGIHFYTEPDGAIRNVDVYNNTIYMEKAPADVPCGIKVQRGLKDVRIMNNLIVVKGVPAIVSIPKDAGVSYFGNCYHLLDGAVMADWTGKKFESLEAWRKETGQERLNGEDIGCSAEPKLAQPGGGKIVDGDLTKVDAYRLKEESPLIGKALDLKKLFGIDTGPRDFHGTRTGSAIGADEGGKIK
ncbi:MAG TPA: right-handed parallel beta-helix repeat-containing protein [Planctomycetota bacterium]|nr:right-handed parallel beta-helix repeat-containing protein [Planctomycetota bacterium]